MNTEQRETLVVDSDIKALLPTFLESIWAGLDELKTFVETNEFAEVCRISHKLRGRLGIIGLSQAAEICFKLEMSAESGFTETLSATFSELVDHIARIQILDGPIDKIECKKKPKILVIDDDEKILEILRLKIGAAYDFFGITNPAFALQCALQTKPNLILCDIDMPELNGGEVSNLLESHPETSGIPFAYLTSFVSPSEVRSLNGIVGGRPGIAKSTMKSEMIGYIEQLLRNFQANV